ncbi:metal-sensing transcriptional repressor [Collimonas sp. H4R21]|jgi:DNA-binding FrmR family transcriptional regulator|uniref:Metal-sensing transcriptional repressor n=1 Tax=Collimonas rhizosphaerae TaxID=3126357 RepID=A0ABU9PZ10_9BURK|nr:metal-sensing transcriptional repressor [Collimonas sp. OK412]SFD22489.1 hypothetical protein NreA [Collimonas sp. OK412]
MNTTHPHKHESHPNVIKRLRMVAGQVNSIISMIEEGRSCTDVAMQLQAAEKALVQAKKTLIYDHLEHCLEDGIETSPKATLDEFKEISKYL